LEKRKKKISGWGADLDGDQRQGVLGQGEKRHSREEEESQFKTWTRVKPSKLQFLKKCKLRRKTVKKKAKPKGPEIPRKKREKTTQSKKERSPGNKTPASAVSF